jgi:hypothetical protein
VKPQGINPYIHFSQLKKQFRITHNWKAPPSGDLQLRSLRDLLKQLIFRRRQLIGKFLKKHDLGSGQFLPKMLDHSTWEVEIGGSQFKASLGNS